MMFENSLEQLKKLRGALGSVGKIFSTYNKDSGNEHSTIKIEHNYLSKKVNLLGENHTKGFEEVIPDGVMLYESPIIICENVQVKELNFFRDEYIGHDKSAINKITVGIQCDVRFQCGINPDINLFHILTKYLDLLDEISSIKKEENVTFSIEKRPFWKEIERLSSVTFIHIAEFLKTRLSRVMDPPSCVQKWFKDIINELDDTLGLVWKEVTRSYGYIWVEIKHPHKNLLQLHNKRIERCILENTKQNETRVFCTTEEVERFDIPILHSYHYVIVNGKYYCPEVETPVHYTRINNDALENVLKTNKCLANYELSSFNIIEESFIIVKDRCYIPSSYKTLYITLFNQFLEESQSIMEFPQPTFFYPTLSYKNYDEEWIMEMFYTIPLHMTDFSFVGKILTIDKPVINCVSGDIHSHNILKILKLFGFKENRYSSTYM